MSIALYMDVHVARAITNGLRLRGIDVLTAQEDGAARLSDSELLVRATALNRVLFTEDEDLLVEAAQRQRLGIAFAGVIYEHPQRTSIGQCVSDLELIARVCTPEDCANIVTFLPL